MSYKRDVWRGQQLQANPVLFLFFIFNVFYFRFVNCNKNKERVSIPRTFSCGGINNTQDSTPLSRAISTSQQPFSASDLTSQLLQNNIILLDSGLSILPVVISIVCQTIHMNGPQPFLQPVNTRIISEMEVVKLRNVNRKHHSGTLPNAFLRNFLF